MILRVLHFSPGSAETRHDSHRAALAFLWFARQAALETRLPLESSLTWALPAITSRSNVHSLLSGADLIVLASPTYAQGSPWFLRRFLELGTGLQLWGGLATAFATAGGHHTGGDVTVADSLRSLHGLGMCTFTFAQKLVVFAAQQKHVPDGTFEPIDVWFLRQLARTAVFHLCLRAQLGSSSDLATQLGLDTRYYSRFPSPSDLASQLGPIPGQLNAPLSHPDAGYSWWTNTLGFDSRPPNPASLPFASLLPEPIPVLGSFPPLAHTGAP
jgi:hypothetical protein